MLKYDCFLIKLIKWGIMSTNLSFPALHSFAKIDNEFINNKLLATVVDTRFTLKCLQVRNNQEASLAAKNALAEVAGSVKELASDPESIRPAFYVSRKIEGFSRKEKVSLVDSFSPSEKTLVQAATRGVYNACSAMALSERASTLFDDQTVERKKYKDEMANLLKSIHAQNPNGDILSLAVNEVKPVIAKLNVCHRTKEYLVYKIGYMFEEFKKSAK